MSAKEVFTKIHNTNYWKSAKTPKLTSLTQLLAATLILTSITLVALAQKTEPIEIDLMALKPRSKKHYNANGHYELAAAINGTEINKGDSALVEVYITGYGQIEQPKILVSCSSNEIFEDFYVQHSLGGKKTGSNFTDVKWGYLKNKLKALPATLEINGGISFTYHSSFNKDSLIDYGNFIDATKDSKSMSLMTEIKIVNPPVAIHFQIKDQARADNYRLNLYLTYFNGSEWVGSNASIDFRINNYLQEHELALGILAAAAALVGIFPGIQILIHFFRFLRKKPASLKHR